MGISAREPLKLALRSPAFRILLVDDTPLNQMVTTHQLKALGFEAIDCVDDGQIALDYLQQNTYDLVLMDCRMPGLDGYETTTIIRRQELAEAEQHQVIVAMTANVMDDERQRCVEVGMDDYISKPITLDSLQDLLERCTKNYFEGERAIAADPAPSTPLNSLNSPIDFEGLKHLLGDDPPLHQMILQELPKSLPAYMEKLEQAIAAGNLTIVSEEAHRLKGSLVMASVKELPQLCHELETSADEQNLEQVQTLAATLKTQLATVYAFIQDYYREHNFLDDAEVL